MAFESPNPIETAEFAIARNIQDKPAFYWWILHVMRKRDRIISSSNARVKKVTRKYGVAIPNSVEECYRLDEQNGNSLCRDALNREMSNLTAAFDILKGKLSLPTGVVSRAIVQIALTTAAPNDMNVCACDNQNAYLQAPTSE